MEDRRTTRGGPLYWLGRRSKRFWIAVAAMPILYVASFGPACWIRSWCFQRSPPYVAGTPGPPEPVLSMAYMPLGWLIENAPRPIDDALYTYAVIGMGRPGCYALVPVDLDGTQQQLMYLREWKCRWNP